MIRRATIACVIGICFVAISAEADQTIASVQQTLKAQGFYYGEITGTKDADTTAAIRRYQIRNGLKITGELNAETQKSLGVHGSIPAPSPETKPQRSAAPVPPPPRVTPPPAASQPQPDTSDLRDDRRQDEPATRGGPGMPPRYAAAPRGLYPATSGVFDRTPFETAPADVQRRVVIGAQSLLGRQGLYRGAVDGAYGSGTEAALRVFQSRFGLPASGRLDMATLAALGLLPGQRGPGIELPRRRVYRGVPIAPYPRERVYIPR